MTTREAARSLRRYGGRASRAASLPPSYTITRGATPDNGLADVPNIAGGIPPAFLNHRAPTA